MSDDSCDSRQRDLEALARRLVDLWERQLAALASASMHSNDRHRHDRRDGGQPTTTGRDPAGSATASPAPGSGGGDLDDGSGGGGDGGVHGA